MPVSMALRDPTICSANFWNSFPDAVTETLPPERSNSFAPTSSSRERICDEIAGWVRKRLPAAREKELNRATSRKVSSWSKSIAAGLDCSGRGEIVAGLPGTLFVIPSKARDLGFAWPGETQIRSLVAALFGMTKGYL